MATIGLTAKISLNDGASNAAQEFAELAMVTVPKRTVSSIDYSYLSQSGRSRRKLPGLIDNGKATFEMNFNKVDYKRLTAILGKRYITGSTEPSWVITTVDEDGATVTLTPLVLTFNGFLTDLDGPEMSPEGLMKIKAEVEVNGAITETDGTNAGAYA